jgi:hypothetical protein
MANAQNVSRSLARGSLIAWLDLIVSRSVIIQFRWSVVSGWGLFLGLLREQPERPKQDVEQQSNGMTRREDEKPPIRVPLLVPALPKHAWRLAARPDRTAKKEDIGDNTDTNEQVSAENAADHDQYKVCGGNRHSA